MALSRLRYALALAVGISATWSAPVSQAQQHWTPEASLKVKRLSDLSFSPDGKHLLYGINSVSLTDDAYLIEFVVSDLAGQNIKTLLAASPHISGAQWSPDGGHVAYLSSETGANNIWIVPAVGGNGRPVTHQKTDIQSFKWSPDGRSIAFVMADPTYVAPPLDDADTYVKNHLWLMQLAEDGKATAPVNLT